MNQCMLTKIEPQKDQRWAPKWTKNGPNGSKLSTKRGPKWGLKGAEVKPKRHLKRRNFKDQKSASGGYQEQNSEIRQVKTCRSNEREAPQNVHVSL